MGASWDLLVVVQLEQSMGEASARGSSVEQVAISYNSQRAVIRSG